MRIKLLVLFVLSWPCLLISCGSENRQPQPASNKHAEIPIVKEASQQQLPMSNEPEDFRGISFGTEIDSLMSERPVVFVRQGYGPLFADKSSSSSTLLSGKLRGRSSTDISPDPEEHRCISCLSQNGKRVRIYRVEGDKLRIGSVLVENIYYHFFNDKFCTVEIRFDSQYWYDMEQIFFEIYGNKDDSADGRIKWHMWEGKNVRIKLWAAPKSPVVEKCFIEYCYLPAQEEDYKMFQAELTQWVEERRRIKVEQEDKIQEEAKRAANDL